LEQVLDLADETWGGTDRVWVIPRRREKRMLTTLVHNEKRKDRTDVLQGLGGTCLQQPYTLATTVRKFESKVGSHTAAT
jgi:hypothetical protein